MSQENPTPEQKQLKNKETRNRLLLGALVLLLGAVVYFQFFSGSDAPKPRASATARVTPDPDAATPDERNAGADYFRTARPGLDAARKSVRAAEPDATSSSTRRRRPRLRPRLRRRSSTPTPWPVPVSSLNPGNVFARTADFTLTVFGQKMPQDAQGFVNGRAYPTTFVNATQVRINVPAEAIRMPGSLSVAVRSQSDPKLESNPIPLNVAPPPEPPYKYIGLITLKNVPTAVLVSQSSDDDDLQRKEGPCDRRQVENNQHYSTKSGDRRHQHQGFARHQLHRQYQVIEGRGMTFVRSSYERQRTDE